MSSLSIAERARVVGRLAAGAGQRLLATPISRLRYGTVAAQALALVPHGLRATDPGFAAGLATGSMSLAGQVLDAGKASPFALLPPSPAWLRSLHDFAWLRHLEAEATEQSWSLAQRLVAQWIERGSDLPGEAFEPPVTGRRIISWLTAASMLLETDDAAVYDRTVAALGQDLQRLSATWTMARVGMPRLEALLGVIYGNLCLIGNEQRLDTALGWLATELNRQILPDGGHISRNSQVLVDVLLDILPLRQCFLARSLPVPDAIDAAIARMMQMLRHLRLGDGSLVRFNGVDEPATPDLTTVLAYDPVPGNPLKAAPDSGYARLERGGLVIIADIGSPPPLEFSGRAGAGTLSFEVSLGHAPVFVNGGRPRVAEDHRLAASRATASHNALVLADRSSARLVRTAQAGRLSAETPLRLSGSVSASQEKTDTCDRIVATHEGYVADHGLCHTRQLEVPADGRALEGKDRLHGPRRDLRLVRDLPFAIHFHIAPSARAAIDMDGTVTLTTAQGRALRFTAAGAQTSLEPSQHFAHAAGVVRTEQIVLRGATFGDTEVTWRLDVVDV